MHQVRKGETWTSIALKYGISEQALRQSNPDAKVKKGKPKKGILLTIPQACAPETTIEEPTATPIKTHI